jgi:hypothetical protein
MGPLPPVDHRFYIKSNTPLFVAEAIISGIDALGCLKWDDSLYALQTNLNLLHYNLYNLFYKKIPFSLKFL